MFIRKDYREPQIMKTYLVCPVAQAVHVVVFVVVRLLVLARDLVQVGVVNGELGVVLLQDMTSCSLYGQFSHGETPRLPVRTADHLDEILRLAGVPELQQEEGEVVEEEERIQETGGVLDNVGVLDPPPLLHQSDPVEEPEGEQEDEEEESDESSEEVDPWEGGTGRSVEHGPRPHCQDEHLEGEGDQETVAVHLALQLGVPHVHELRVWEDQHEDGTEEAEDGEGRHQELPGVPLTGEPPALLRHVLLQLEAPVRKAEVRHPRHGGVVGPVLREHLNLQVRIILILDENCLLFLIGSIFILIIFICIIRNFN